MSDPKRGPGSWLTNQAYCCQNQLFLMKEESLTGFTGMICNYTMFGLYHHKNNKYINVEKLVTVKQFMNSCQVSNIKSRLSWLFSLEILLLKRNGFDSIAAWESKTIWSWVELLRRIAGTFEINNFLFLKWTTSEIEDDLMSGDGR